MTQAVAVNNACGHPRIMTHLQDIAARDVVVVEHLPFGQDLLVPAREVVLFPYINANQILAIGLCFCCFAGRFSCSCFGNFYRRTRCCLLRFFRCQFLLFRSLFESILGHFRWINLAVHQWSWTLRDGVSHLGNRVCMSLIEEVDSSGWSGGLQYIWPTRRVTIRISNVCRRQG